MSVVVKAKNIAASGGYAGIIKQIQITLCSISRLVWCIFLFVDC